jgi:uncharacterized protein (TIGR02099 family)
MSVSPLPSRLLKFWSALTRWLLAVVVLGWVALGLAWGALQFWIVPRVEQWREPLQQRASQVLGIEVRIAALRAHSTGWMPAIELEQVSLYDVQGRAALVLPRVWATVSARSLLQRGLEQLYIEAPSLDVRRLADGRLEVAGLDLGGPAGALQDTLDWVFSQRELVIHGGTLRWSNEQHGTVPMVWREVALVLRNRGRTHDWRLDATPEAQVGQCLSARGRLLSPLWTLHPGRVQDWAGELYAEGAGLDLAALQHGFGVAEQLPLRSGWGALRLWATLAQGRLTQAVADVALRNLNAQVQVDLPPLVLPQLQARLSLNLPEGGWVQGWRLGAEELHFVAGDGVKWPGGRLALAYQTPTPGKAAQGQFQADALDLGVLAQLAQQLPLNAQWQRLLAQAQPQGQARGVSLSWQGEGPQPARYRAQAQLRGLALASVQTWPGVRGLDAELTLDQDGGQARLALEQGAVLAADWLPIGEVPVDHLSGQLRWHHDPRRQWTVQLQNLHLSNAHAQGQVNLSWRSPERPADLQDLGTLDVQAQLNRADVAQLHRYLPLGIPQQARDYVRLALLAGRATQVRFDVQGPLAQLPWPDAKQGHFRVQAQVQDGKLAYVPPALQDAGDAPWPALADVAGEVLMDGPRLTVRKARARSADDPAVQVSRAEVQIADLNHTVVQVQADVRAPLASAFKLVRASPVNALTHGVLADMGGSGAAELKLRLQVPVDDVMHTQVQGSVVLAGNDVVLSNAVPRLERVRGQLAFNQNSLQLQGVQARWLGGEARAEGGLVFVPAPRPGTQPQSIAVDGTASAEGLRAVGEWPELARLAQTLQGSAPYSASLNLNQDQLEWQVRSDLQGLAVQAPAPLGKPAAQAQALRLQRTALAQGQRERWTLVLPGLAAASLERDLRGAQPRLLRGALAVGAPALAPLNLPKEGLAGAIELPSLDADAWVDWAERAGLSGQAGEAAAGDGLPATLVVQADSAQVAGRNWRQLVLGATRADGLWRGNLHASELDGYLEYRPVTDARTASGAGRLYARLSHLALPAQAQSDVEAYLDAQPASMPALDIVVDDFELGPRSLGRLEIEALNRPVSGTPGSPPEWRLNRFNLTVPEATLQAHGNWARVAAQAGTGPRAGGLPRRTVLNFNLQARDAGVLLARFGMPGVIRQANGKIEGQLAWRGSPFHPDIPSLGGAFKVDMVDGQFLKADPGLAKLLGVLSLQSLPRRLTLDFRDVFSQGFAFDFLRGDVQVQDGVAHTNNLQMKGVNAAVMMEGSADVATETQNVRVVVVPEINAGTASLVASVINPAVGLGSFLAQWVLRRPLIESSTQTFQVDGSWYDPRVTPVPAAAAASSPVEKNQ